MVSTATPSGPAADGIEVLDEIVAIRAERSVALAGIKRVHHEPFRIRGACQVADFLENIVTVAADHPVVVRKIAELQLQRAGEDRVHVHLHFRQTDVDIGVAYRARHRKLVEADRPVDLVHIEWHMFEGAKLGPGTLGHLRDPADLHGEARVAAHRAPLADQNLRGILFLHQFDQRFQHARVGGEPFVGRHRDDRIDLDQNLIAAFDDLRHAAHGLVRDVADHSLDDVQLRPRTIGGLAEIRIGVSDANRCFLRHKTVLFRQRPNIPSPMPSAQMLVTGMLLIAYCANTIARVFYQPGFGAANRTLSGIER